MLVILLDTEEYRDGFASGLGRQIPIFSLVKKTAPSWCGASTPLVLLHHHHGGLGCREEYITERSLKLKHMNQSGKLQSCQSLCSFFSGKVHRQHHFFTIAERGKRIPESIKWNCEHFLQGIQFNTRPQTVPNFPKSVWDWWPNALSAY